MIAIRALEESVAELQRIAAVVAEGFQGYDEALDLCREHGIDVALTMPAPLAGGYGQWRQRLDLRDVQA